jgi:hypothetical protein
MSSFAYGRFFARPEHNLASIKAYERLWASDALRLVKEIRPEGPAPGPVIKIFEVRNPARRHRGEGDLILPKMRVERGCVVDHRGELWISRWQWAGQKLLLEPGRYAIEGDIEARAEGGVWPILMTCIDGNIQRFSVDSASGKKTILGSIEIGQRRPCWFYLMVS